MKFVIASDIHGSAFWCGKLLELVEREKPDKLLLLGDILYHGPRNDLPREYAPKQVIEMLNRWKNIIVCVRGNCEAEVDQMVLPFPCMADYAEVLADGKSLFLTHGHHFGPEQLPNLEEGAILLCGHTHVPCCHRHENFTYLNPGSTSIPKNGSAHSYAVLEGNTMIWKDLEGGEYMREEIWK